MLKWDIWTSKDEGWRYICGFREGFLETNISELRYERWFEIGISWGRSQKLHRDALSSHSCIFLKNIYSFGCACSHLLHAGSFSYCMWNLVPWPGIERRPLHWECGVIASGSPGKSQRSCILISHLVVPFDSIMQKHFPFEIMIFMLCHLTGNTIIFSTILETDRKFLYKFHQNSTQAAERRPAYHICLLIWY